MAAACSFSTTGRRARSNAASAAGTLAPASPKAGNGAELAKPTYGKALAKVLSEDMSKWDVMVKASGAKVD